MWRTFPAGYQLAKGLCVSLALSVTGSLGRHSRQTSRGSYDINLGYYITSYNNQYISTRL